MTGRPTKASLDRLKETFKPKGGRIIPPVQRMLMKSAGDVERDTAHVHPSEVAKSDWCSRRANLRISGAEPNKKSSNTSSKMEMVFQEGHDIHHKWQEWIRYADGLDLIGRWQCDRCGEDWFGEDKDYCPLCKDALLSYKEVPFHSEEFHMMGHADGIVKVDGEAVLIEIKSIGMGTLMFEDRKLHDAYVNGDKTIAEVWRDIKRPFPSHMRQGQMYLWLANLQYPLLDIREIIFIYDFKPTQEVKEFSVKANVDLIADRIEDIKAVAQTVGTDKIVDRPEWASLGGNTCASCEFSNACYGTSEEEQPEPLVPERRVNRSTSAKRRRAVRPS